MFNKVFGEIEFEYGWNGSIEMDCFGKDQSVDLILSGEMECGKKNFRVLEFC